jgi:hypothetical protein
MNTTQNPTGLTALILSAIGIVDLHWLHSGLDNGEWLVIIGLASALVSKFTPRNV